MLQLKIKGGTGRIILKERVVIEGRGHQIIEVDGVEYISQYQGGICPLVKK